MTPALKIVLLVVVLADIAIGSFYGGLQYARNFAPPSVSERDAASGQNTFTGRVVSKKTRESNTITVRLQDGTEATYMVNAETVFNFTLSPGNFLSQVPNGAYVGITTTDTDGTVAKFINVEDATRTPQLIQ